MGKRSRRSTAQDEEEWDPTCRPKVSRSRPTVRDPSDSDSSQTTKGSTTSAPRRGGRTRVACDQCSKRRSRCSLEGPACEGCIERGDPEACSYQALIWIENVEDLPSRQLRRKLDALEALIGSLSRQTTLPIPPPKPSPVQLAVSLPPASPLSEFADNSVSVALASCRDSLARSLFVNGTLSNLHLPEGVRTPNLDYELRRIDNNFQLSTARLPPATPTCLPTPPQAHLAICFFSSTLNPTFRLIYEPIFFRECQEFWASGLIPSPMWLALYLAISAAGFRVVLGDKEALSQSGLHEDEVAQLADKCWTESRDILENEGFPLANSLESIQVALTLASSTLYGDSSNVSRASSLIAQASNAALDFGLDVDPREGPAIASQLDVELRRRTFWALYTCETMINMIVGKDSTDLCSANPSVRRPLFLSNDCYLASGSLSPIGIDAVNRSIPTSPTSSLFTVATLAVKAARLIKAGGATRDSDIIRVLEEMEAFDGAFRSCPVAESMFRASFIRLHQASKELNLPTKERDAIAARHLDNLLRSAITIGSPQAPDLMFFSTMFSLNTALRSCLVLYDGQVAFERNRPDLRQFAAALSSSFRSTALRLPASRCATIISHIIDDRRRASLEATPSLVGSSLATPNSETTLASPAGSAPVSAVEPQHRYQAQLPTDYHFDDSANAPFSISHALEHETPEISTVPQVSLPPNRSFATRPLLSLRTSVGTGGQKPLTPVLSPWQDASQTPSRYIGYAWSNNLFSLPE